MPEYGWGRGPLAGDACEDGGEKEGKMTALKGTLHEYQSVGRAWQIDSQERWLHLLNCLT